MSRSSTARTRRGPGRAAFPGERERPAAALLPRVPRTSSRATPSGGARGDAPTRVVLVHGVRTSGTMWRRQVAELAATGFEAVAVDLPGHGARSAETFTLEGACAVLDEAVSGAPGRVVVVGLSLGGYVTLSWAGAGGIADGLVLSSCTARPGGAGHRTFIAVSRAIVATGAADRISARAAALAVGAEAAEAVGAGGIASAAQVATLRAVLPAQPLADLRRITGRGIPVTFIQGEWDHFRLDEREFRAAAPGARWLLVRRAHHLVSLHRPAAYGRALRDALRWLDA